MRDIITVLMSIYLSIDINLFNFTVMEIGNWVDADQSTGRIIHVPNGKVFNETQANYNKGFEHIWNEIREIHTTSKFEGDLVVETISTMSSTLNIPE